MKLLFQIAFILCALHLRAQNSFDLGNKAYLDAKYMKAIDYFEKAIKDDSNNISAYYNLGMAHQQNKSYGKAIWAFEKVLKLDPSDEQTEEQIMHCFMELKGEQYEWNASLGPMQKAMYSVSSFSWSIVAIVLSILLSVAVIYKGIKKEVNAGSFYLITGTVGVVFVLVLCLAGMTHSFENQHNTGVITKRSVASSLDVSQKNKGPEIEEGSRLEVLERTDKGLYKVKDENNNVLFISQSDIELI